MPLPHYTDAEIPFEGYDERDARSESRYEDDPQAEPSTTEVKATAYSAYVESYEPEARDG